MMRFTSTHFSVSSKQAVSVCRRLFPSSSSSSFSFSSSQFFSKSSSSSSSSVLSSSSSSTSLSLAFIPHLTSSFRLHAGCSHNHGGGGGSHHHHHHPSHLGELLNETISSKTTKNNNNNTEATTTTTTRNPALERCKQLTYLATAVNMFYSFFKIWLGTAGGSVALVADGLHCVVDFLSDIVAIIALRFAADTTRHRCRFPFGVGRVEQVGAIFIALILILGALSVAATAVEKLFDFIASSRNRSGEEEGGGGENSDIAEKNKKKKHSHGGHGHHDHDHGGGILSMFRHDHSVEIFATTEEEQESGEGGEKTSKTKILWSMVFIAVSSIFVKEGLYRALKKAGEKANSISVISNAYHHRADAWTAGLGLFGVVSSHYGYGVLDSIAGLGVAAFILQIGWSTLKFSVLNFFDYQDPTVRPLIAAATKTPPPPPPFSSSSSLSSSQKLRTGTCVNVFFTRHGLKSVLHGTLLVRHDATADQIAILESQIMSNMKEAGFWSQRDLFDVFLKIRPIDISSKSFEEEEVAEERNDKNNSKKKRKKRTRRIVGTKDLVTKRVSTEENKEQEEKQEKKQQEADDHDEEEEEEEEVELVVDEHSDLVLALREVCNFHGVEVGSGIEFFFDNKKSKTTPTRKIFIYYNVIAEDCQRDIMAVANMFGIETELKGEKA